MEVADNAELDEEEMLVCSVIDACNETKVEGVFEEVSDPWLDDSSAVPLEPILSPVDDTSTENVSLPASDDPEVGFVMILDEEEVACPLSEDIWEEPVESVLLSFIEIVGSPSSPSSSPSSLPFVSSVPLAAFEKPIDELGFVVVVTRGVAETADLVLALAALSDVALVLTEVADATVSRSIVDALVSLAYCPVLGVTAGHVEEAWSPPCIDTGS